MPTLKYKTPRFKDLMLPALEAIAASIDGAPNGNGVPLDEIRVRITNMENLPPEAFEERHPSGKLVFVNRVGRALSYMKHADLVESAGNGIYRLTEEGKSLLATRPVRIDMELLDQYPKFAEWKNSWKSSKRQP